MAVVRVRGGVVAGVVTRAVLERLKVVGVNPGAVAETVKLPTAALAVKGLAVAIPLALVMAVFAPVKLPEAPELGKVNVMERPEVDKALLKAASATWTEKLVLKGLLTVVAWLSPVRGKRTNPTDS